MRGSLKRPEKQGDPGLQIHDPIKEGPVEDQGDAGFRRGGRACICLYHRGGRRLGALLVHRSEEHTSELQSR